MDLAERSWALAFAGFTGLVGLASLALNAKIGRRRWWGLLLALLPVLIGGFAFVLLFVTANSLPGFYAIAGIPLVCGLFSLMLWRRVSLQIVRPKPKSPR